MAVDPSEVRVGLIRTDVGDRRFSSLWHEENVLEFASPTVRGSRLAAQLVGECAFSAVRGEHLTMRALASVCGS
jgi:hypothetical protein